MDLPPSTSDTVRSELAAYASENITVVLEGSAPSSNLAASVLMLIPAAMVVPLLVAKGAYLAAVCSLMMYGAVGALVHSQLSRAPNDIILTQTSLHLLWRSLKAARHRAIPLASIAEVELARTRTFSTARPVMIRTNAGETLQIKLMSVRRGGVYPRYTVVTNLSSQVFDPRVHDANHALAFVQALREAVERSR